MAESNVKSGYLAWARAFDGDISMMNYLESITNLPETGEKAREVARHLLNKDQGRIQPPEGELLDAKRVLKNTRCTSLHTQT